MSVASFPSTDGLLRTTDPFLGRRGRPYRPHKDLVAAANVALALDAPLLLTGEPGCGKTDFAFAAATALCAASARIRETVPQTPLECYVRSDTRAQDLLYMYDAVRRFGDAQHGESRDARDYIELQALGRALMSRERRVVLIDEIDKSPMDLPNDLLRELDQGNFEIPEIPSGVSEVTSHGILLRRQMRRPDGARLPLVVITSNVERQLPDAFLRRCVFYHIEFPDRAALLQILVDNLQELLPPDSPVLSAMVDIFLSLRSYPYKLTKPPATAELLAFGRGLLTGYPKEEGVVTRVLNFARGLSSETVMERPWRSLPGLTCLVKLREDLEKLPVPGRA